MKDHSGMAEIAQMRGVGFRESMLMALAIYGVARGGEAVAADAAPRLEMPRAQFVAPLLAHPLLSPSFAAAPAPVEPELFSASEFRPRKRGFSQFNAAQSETRLADMPRLQDNSIARQLAELKSQDRLRLLTLWQSRASSWSLQTKRGAPSLQWSTPLVHRDGSPRGLFDHLLSVSPQGAFGGTRNTTPRQPGVPSPSKSLELGSALKPP
jgi:hypothetical protein